MGPRNRIIIELSPAAIDGASIRFGRVVRRAHVELDPTDWRQAWEEGLSSFDGPLSAIIEQLDAKGATADVAYRSPTSFAEIISVPVTGAAAIGAVKLALADHVGFALDVNPYAIESLSKIEGKNAKGAMALAIADNASASQVLAGWLGRAGCELACACPASGLSLVSAVREAASHGAGAVSARLYLDRRLCVLTVASAGAVRMVRRIEIGFEDLVTSITRPIVRRDADGESITLARRQAGLILCGAGIPRFNDPVEPELGLTGRDLLPLLQPALQRLAIEIKQSFRFELSDEERGAIELRCTGPFGAMPGLAQSLNELIEINAVSEGTLDPAIIEAPFLNDDDRPLALARCARSNPIVAEQVLGAQRLASFRFGARAGAVAAALTLLATALVTSSQIRAERRAARSLDAAVAQVDEIIALNQSILTQSDTLAATHRRMSETIGKSTRWYAPLAALPGLIPDSVSLVEVGGADRSEKGPARLEITGVAGDSDGGDAQAALNEFIRALNDCPLVESVDLGTTNRVSASSDSGAMRFSVVINLVPTPRRTVAAAPTEAMP
ncbi:MAG: PilN domain-containing protein [Phycisphaeraceae bacterium]|nr:PilN domain-containing protein [Phycisphaeraceae bacterium]